VAGDRGEPPRHISVPARDHPKPGDGPLPTLVVAVEHIDRERLRLADVFAEGRIVGVARIADRALPEPRMPGWDVEVPVCIRNCSGSACAASPYGKSVVTLHPNVTASPEPTFRTEMAR